MCEFVEVIKIIAGVIVAIAAIGAIIFGFLFLE